MRLGVALLLTVGAMAQPLDPKLEERARQLTVLISAGAERGAGFLVGEDAEQYYIATAAHVVAGDGVEAGARVHVRFFGTKEPLAARVHPYRSAATLDFALVLVRKPGGVSGVPYRVLPRSGAPLRRGAKLYPVGHPPGRDWYVPAAPSYFNQLEHGELSFETQSITGGNSGGPLFNAAGELAGMVFQDEGAHGRALPLAVLQEMLREAKVPVKLAPAAAYTPPADGSPEELTRALMQLDRAARGIPSLLAAIQQMEQNLPAGLTLRRELITCRASLPQWQAEAGQVRALPRAQQGGEAAKLTEAIGECEELTR